MQRCQDFFQKQNEDFEQPKRAGGLMYDRKTIVCLVDEMDFLITQDEGVVYNFFNWAMLPGSGLLLVGVK